MLCLLCGKTCGEKRVDFGVLPNHPSFREVSDCCSEEMVSMMPKDRLLEIIEGVFGNTQQRTKLLKVMEYEDLENLLNLINLSEEL